MSPTSTPVMPVSWSSDHDGEESEVGLRFSRSFSDAKPTLYWVTCGIFTRNAPFWRLSFFVQMERRRCLFALIQIGSVIDMS